jgi:hypothetical protein
MGILTVAGAERMLPLVRRIVLSARVHHRLIKRWTAGAAAPDSPDERKHGVGLRFLREEFEKSVAELEQLGCTLLDPATGLIACRSLIDGEPAFITWQPGQPGFTEWYRVNETPDRRKPIAAAASAAR